MEQKGQDVPDVRTPACMKAPEVPPLLVRASDQSPERIAGRLSKFSRAWSEIGADPWVMRIVQWGYKIPVVTLPPLRLQGQETTYLKGSLNWSSLNQSVQELRNKGAIEPAPLTPGFYSRLFLVRKATGEWRPIIDLSSLNVFVHCPKKLHYGDASVNPQGPTTGPVVNLPRPERCLLSYRDRPSGQTLPTLLSQRHRLAIYSTAIRVVNQSESIYQNTQTCTSICPPPSGKIAHVHRRLVVKPRDTPGSSRANILAQVPVPKARVGFKPREIGSNPFSGCHVSGDRAGHSCRPGKAATQEVDQLAFRSGGIHSTAVTICCPVAPSTWTPSLSRETSALWSNSHSSHSTAIETPLESVEGEILQTDSTRPSVPPGHPMVDQQGQFTKGSPNRDHRCGVLPVHTQQYSGLGCPLAGINCIWHLIPGPIPTTHQCPGAGASSHMAWLKSFQPEIGECEGCSHVRQHVCGCLPEKSGGHQIEPQTCVCCPRRGE